MRRYVAVKLSIFPVSLLACYFCSYCVADDNTVKLKAATGLLYNSNPDLRPDDGYEINGSLITLGGDFRNYTENSKLSASISATDEAISEDGAKEDDRASLRVDGFRKFQTTFISANIDLQAGSTLAQEIQASSPIEVERERLKSVGAVNVGLYLNEKCQLTTGINTEKVDYRDNADAVLAEYTYYASNVATAYNLSERTILQGSVFASDLTNENSPYENRTYGASVSASYAYSEKSKITAMGGRRKTEYSYELFEIEFGQETYGTVSSLEWEYRHRRGQMLVTSGYDLLPNGAGNLVERARLELESEYKLSEMLQTFIKFVYWQQRSDLVTESFEDLNSLRVSAMLRWRFRESLYLSGRMEELRRDLINQNVKANAEKVSIELNWMNDFGL